MLFVFWRPHSNAKCNIFQPLHAFWPLNELLRNKTSLWFYFFKLFERGDGGGDKKSRSRSGSFLTKITLEDPFYKKKKEKKKVPTLNLSDSPTSEHFLCWEQRRNPSEAYDSRPRLRDSEMRSTVRATAAESSRGIAAGARTQKRQRLTNGSPAPGPFVRVSTRAERLGSEGDAASPNSRPLSHKGS